MNRNRITSEELSRCFQKTERLLLVIGTILPGIYGATQIHAAISSRVDLWRFRMLQQVARAEGSMLEKALKYEELYNR